MDEPRHTEYVYVRAGWLEKSILILLTLGIMVGVFNWYAVVRSNDIVISQHEKTRQVICQSVTEEQLRVLVCAE